MQDIILTVSIILAYAAFGVACAVIGYKKGVKYGEKAGYCKGMSFVCDEVRKIIKEPNPLSVTVKWVPTAERMPDARGEYIVLVKGRDKATALYYSPENEFYERDDGGEAIFYNVTYWAEFPEIPDGSSVKVSEEKKTSLNPPPS